MGGGEEIRKDCTISCTDCVDCTDVTESVRFTCVIVDIETEARDSDRLEEDRGTDMSDMVTRER